MQPRFDGLPKPVELLIGNTGFVEMLNGTRQIIGILTRLADAMRNHLDLLVKLELARILLMAAIHHKTQCFNALLTIHQRHACLPLHINQCHLFAFTQVVSRRRRLCRLNAKGDTPARAARVQPEHQSRSLSCATMHMAKDAKITMIAMQPRLPSLNMIKSGPPHQRPISKHP